MPVRILVADDSQRLRDDVRILLNSRTGWKVVAEATNGREAVQKAGQVQPDVVIIDYSMPELDGISAIPQIRAAAPQAEVVVLTVHDAPFTVGRAVKAGACGYVVKSEIIRNLVPAIEAASRHETFLTFYPEAKGRAANQSH